MTTMNVTTRGGQQLTFPDRPGRRMILLKVNTVCNLSCDYCWYVVNPAMEVPVREETTRAQMRDMLDEIALQAGDVVYLSGGEAVLRRDIALVCRSVRASGATVYLTTNGILLSRLLALAPHIDGYVVSLDGIDADAHNHHRGGHEATIRNLPELVAARPVCVTIVLSRDNLDQVLRLAAACTNWGVTSVFYQLLWLPTNSLDRPKRCLQPADLGRLRDALEELERRYIGLRLPDRRYRLLLEAVVAEGGASGRVENCFAMERYLTTDPRGGVLPCLPHNHVKGGPDRREPPWSDGVCHHMSEECICLMGHYHTDLFPRGAG